MAKRPGNVIKDKFDGVVPFEFMGSFVGGEGKLISYFPRLTFCYLVNFWHIAGGKELKGD